MEIKYQTDNSKWGLAGFYEGQKLVFYAPENKSSGEAKKLKTELAALHHKKTAGYNLYDLFSPTARQAWQTAQAHAKKHRRDMGLEDIFLSLLEQQSVKDLLKRFKVETADAELLVKNYLRLRQSSSSEHLKRIPFEAFVLAEQLLNHKVGSLMLLGALIKTAPHDSILAAMFTNIGLTLEKLEIFAVWILNLKYEFPSHSNAAKLLYCCQQSQSIEEHFKYYFEFPAIEAAVKVSSKATLKDLEHKKSLQILIKAAGLAQKKGTKIINESLIHQATS